ncbi:hypothetical protein QO008_000378 [Peptoniphilus ivorii]|uniref:hypothetical protein n=1 Tax=Aedoeadaptatus ivorii TaxID=54006 RepID=UPI002787DAEA|nr:hypothetical protein [Peptoniphilus ivorii]MDQ0507934.1 hypothetical protein [Peptoniphilus ivorii]
MKKWNSILFLLILFAISWIANLIEPNWINLSYEGKVVFADAQAYRWLILLVMGIISYLFIESIPERFRGLLGGIFILIIITIYILAKLNVQMALQLLMNPPKYFPPIPYIAGFFVVDYWNRCRSKSV